jgi:hypothetical protein
MPTIKLQNGNVLLKEGKAACSCCVDPTAPAFAAMPFALCGYSWWSEQCAFEEFTDPPDIVASCPPKFYATKTVTVSDSWTSNTGCGFPNSGPRSKTEDWYISYGKTLNEADECVEVVIDAGGTVEYSSRCGCCKIEVTHTLASDGTWSYSGNYFIDRTASSFCAGVDDDYCGATGPFSGSGLYGVAASQPQSIGAISQVNSTTTAQNSTGQQQWTLSDELSDGRSHDNCDITPCNSGDVPATPGCKSTCTDRGSGEPGMAIEYNGIEEESSNGGPCQVYRSGSLGWEREPTCTPRNTTGEWAAQGVDVWWWAKNLTVGNYYKARFEFKRCCYDDALDDEDPDDYQKCGEPLYPCNVDGGDNIIYTTPTAIEIVFQAEAWAEIITPSVTIPEVRYKKCQLEDEAAAWNAANPGETPRTVVEGGSPVAVPQTHPCYTWLEATSFEAL